MKDKRKLSLSLAMVGLSCGLIGFGGYALFSDYTGNHTEGTAGTVSIDMSKPVLTNPLNVNPGDNDPDAEKKYVPEVGDPLYDANYPNREVNIKSTSHDLSFSVQNNGTKSIRNRQTIIISVKDKENNEVLDASVFSLFDKDKELVSKKYVTEHGEYDEIPVSQKVIAIKYVYTPDIFDGVGVGAEKEAEASVKNKDDVSKKTYKYQFAMDKQSSINKYQGCNINIEVITEAMQYRNTVQDDWKVISTETIKASASDTNVNVVPVKE